MKEDLKIGDTVTADCHVYPNDGGGCDYIVAANGPDESVVGKWISVKDKMPDKKEPVVYMRSGQGNQISVGIAYWTVSNKWNPLHESAADPEGFTHWMPLPEPPK